MKLRAYAKINLGIHVIAKRPDGFHNIETIYHQVNLFDEIELFASREIEFETASPDVPKDSTNIIVQAANLVRREYKSSQGAHIDLTKHIPVGAGLGGGSSDAAAVLKGLVNLWNLPKEPPVLKSIAATLGSDVPFFLEGGTAFATGRGEILNHFELSIPYWILVATPPLHIPTAWAYANLEMPPRKNRIDLRSSVERMMINSAVAPEPLVNDFETLVFRSHPEVKALKETILREGALCASMSGSGSSVFGLFRDGQRARASAARLPQTVSVSLTEPHFKAEPRAD